MTTVIKVVADSVTINHSGRISYKENSNDISDSIVSGSFNNSSASPRGGGQVLNDDHDVALGYSRTITNDVEENFQAPASHNSAHHRFSGSQRDRRVGLRESPGNLPRFHSTERPSQPQAASDARRPPMSLDPGNHGSSSPGVRPASFPPNTPPHREQRASRGPLCVRHDPYGEHHVHDGAQHPSSSEVQSTDKKPHKNARRCRRSRRTKAKMTQPTSHGPSCPSTSSHSLYESRSTYASHSMLHSPVTSHSAPLSQCSSSSCSCAGSRSSLSPNSLHHAPMGTLSPRPYGQQWANPAHADQHIIATHYPTYLQPFYFFIAHPVHYHSTALSHSPEPRFSPIPIPPPVSGPAPFIQQPSESLFRPHYPDSDPNTPTRDTSYDHTSAAAIESMHHPTAQTPSSSNLSQFAAHMLSLRHEGHSRMSVTPHPAAQTLSSSNLPQFSAPTPSWRHEGPPQMSMAPRPAAQTPPSRNFPQFATHTPS